MKRVLMVMAILALFSTNAFGQAKQKIAFVDITEVLMKYKKQLDSANIFKKKQVKFKADVENFIKKYRQVVDDIKSSTDEEERLELRFKALKSKKRLKFFQEMNKERISMEIEKLQVEMIKDIKKAINDLGKVKGYFMILQTHPPMPKGEEARSAMMQINVADVLYYDANYDISEAVVIKLNQAYENKQRILKKIKAGK